MASDEMKKQSQGVTEALIARANDERPDIVQCVEPDVEPGNR